MFSRFTYVSLCCLCQMNTLGGCERSARFDWTGSFQMPFSSFYSNPLELNATYKICEWTYCIWFGHGSLIVRKWQMSLIVQHKFIIQIYFVYMVSSLNAYEIEYSFHFKLQNNIIIHYSTNMQ